MSQNKTIVPGVTSDMMSDDGAMDSFYASLYNRSSSDDNHTCIDGSINSRLQNVGSTSSSPAQVVSQPIIQETSRAIKVKNRVIVGVMFSVSKGLLGEMFPVYLGKNIIGKDSKCDIVLNENTVSEEHAIIYTFKNDSGIEASIMDINSVYGTLVNDMDARYENVSVHENDRISIGQHYKFIVKLFETDKYNMSEDPEFEESAVLKTEVSLSNSTDYSQSNTDDEFYRPSMKRDSDSSHTVLY